MPRNALSAVDFLAPIRVIGADARAFLQGQLSNDIDALDSGICQLASCSSPQGRVQAILTLVPQEDGLLLILPASMAALTLKRLRKYVLRSKVSLQDAASALEIRSADRDALLAAGLPCPETPGGYRQQDAVGVLRWHEPGAASSPRFLVLATAGVLPRAAESGDTPWRLADIRAGLPQVLPETHEHFVAQMLNLDLVGGISFSKGCYTGQEIIARTQYRGAIKRRMLRFSAACAPPLPGTRVLQGDSHAGDVVDAAATPQGCELLAVVNLTQSDGTLALATAAGVPLAPLPMPYDVKREGLPVAHGDPHPRSARPLPAGRGMPP